MELSGSSMRAPHDAVALGRSTFREGSDVGRRAWRDRERSPRERSPALTAHHSPTGRISAEAVATLARTVQSLPMEQVLDLAITQMRTLRREKGEPIPTAPRAGVRFSLVPIPTMSAPSVARRKYKDVTHELG